ncbi:MAG TPA: phosphoribosylformylglycinamidine synthase I [Candidatus Nanoarchaeia archaeon]|nr:phosphoribosylformylglycinamidine synthase I [Candidatus Nanoarchaeia archaeon]
MVTPHVLVLTGYGINCDEETKFAFEKAGARADIVHINDLIDGQRQLRDYQILAFPGGFSYGDDTGSGNALANRIRNHLWDEVQRFIDDDHLAIGICNGFQVMVNLGLLPALGRKYGERRVALVHNDSARYMDRWVDLQFQGKSPWVEQIGRISLPIAHGEGKFFADDRTLAELQGKGLVAARYIAGEICGYQNLPANPNGSLDNIAGITDESGRLIGMMPHPERAIEFTHRPDWTLLKEMYRRAGQDLPTEASGIIVFKNGVKYFA